MEGMKVAHQDEKQDYERQLSELRAEYTKTKDELDGDIIVLTNQNTALTNHRRDHGADQEAGFLGGVPPAEGAVDERRDGGPCPTQSDDAGTITVMRDRIDQLEAKVNEPEPRTERTESDLAKVAADIVANDKALKNVVEANDANTKDRLERNDNDIKAKMEELHRNLQEVKAQVAVADTSRGGRA